MKKKNFVLAMLVSAFSVGITACGGEGETTSTEKNDSTKTAEEPGVKKVPAQTITVGKSFTVVRESDIIPGIESAEVTVAELVLPYSDEAVVLQYIPEGEQIVRVDLSIKNTGKKRPYTMTSGEIKMEYGDSTFFDANHGTDAFKKSPEYFGEILDLGKFPEGEAVKKTLFFRLPLNANLDSVRIIATSHLKKDKKEIVGINVK